MKKLLMASLVFFCSCVMVQEVDSQERRWTFDPQSQLTTGPAIGPDGTIYITTRNGKVYAVTSEGNELWNFTTGNEFSCPPVVAADGTIYVLSSRLLHALAPNGTLKWQFPLDGVITANPALGANGAIHLATDAGNLFAINPDGVLLWSMPIPEVRQLGVGADGAIYLLPNLRAVDPAGHLKWVLSIGSQVPFSGANMAINGGDGLYVAAESDYRCSLFSIRTNGSIEWKLVLNGSVSLVPSAMAAANGYIYVPSGYRLFVVNENGTLHQEIEGIREGTAVLATRQGAYYTSAMSDVCRFASPSALYCNQLYYLEPYWSPSAMNIGSDGTMYAAEPSGLVAVSTPDSGLAEASWPRIGRDSRNSFSMVNANTPRAIVAADTVFIQPGETITLDGSASYDPDDEPLNYSWQVVETASGYRAQISSPEQVVTQLTVQDRGYYRVALTVSDGEDGVSSQSVHIYCGIRLISAPPNTQLQTSLLATDGTLYFTAMKSPSGETGIYQGSPDGQTSLFYKSDEALRDRLTMAEDGTVYFFSHYLEAINPDGTQKWQLDLNRGHSMALGRDGTLYAVSDSITQYPVPWSYDFLNAITPSGERKWRYALSRNYTYVPIIAPDGRTIYLFGQGDGHFFALRDDGTMKLDIGSRDLMQPLHSPIVADDGTIHIMESDTLFALDPDGQKTKSIILPTPMVPLVMGGDGTLFLSDYDSTLYAVMADGTLKWSYQAHGIIEYWEAGAVLDKDGFIYLTTSEGLEVINGTGTLAWHLSLPHPITATPIISPNGSVYLTVQNSIYIIQSLSRGLAEEGWPVARKDYRNSSSNYDENCPVAIIQADEKFVPAQTTFALNGSESFDPDDDGLNFLWQCIAKPEGSVLTIEDAISPVALVELMDRGEYTFSLMVSDGDDGRSAELVTINSGAKWAHQVPARFNTPVAIGYGGVIYFGAQDSILYALDSNGVQQWKFKFPGRPSAPVVGPDGSIYVACSFNLREHYLYSLDPQGQVRWSLHKRITGYLFSAPAIAADGTIYTTIADTLIALQPDGTTKWTYIGHFYSSSTGPVIGPSGDIYIRTHSGRLMAVSAAGDSLWTSQHYSPLESYVVIDANGNIVTTGYSDASLPGLRRLRPDGSAVSFWEIEGLRSNIPPVINADGTTYVATQYYGRNLLALNSDGTKKWSVEMTQYHEMTTMPLIGADGQIYVGWIKSYPSVDIELYAFNKNGDLRWTHDVSNFLYAPPALAEDGTMYLPSALQGGYNLLAIRTDSKGLAASPWPRFRGNNQNSNGPNYGPVLNVESKTENRSTLPKDFVLQPNYPNPFNPSTQIRFGLPKNSEVELAVFNLSGQKVRSLFSGNLNAGWHVLTWSARDEHERPVASGVYLVRLKAGEIYHSRKMLLLK